MSISETAHAPPIRLCWFALNAHIPPERTLSTISLRQGRAQGISVLRQERLFELSELLEHCFAVVRIVQIHRAEVR